MSKIIPIRDAERAARKAAKAPPADPPPAEDLPDAECPVAALGHCQGNFWFFDVAGQLVTMSAQNLGAAPQVLALFGPRRDWLADMFPLRNKEGDVIPGRFNNFQVNAYLVDVNIEAGLFDREKPVRGVGVWRIPGGLALHTGDRVHFPADDATPMRRAGFIAHSALWPAHPRIPPPAAPATPADALWIEEQFARWPWRRGHYEARLMFGLWAAGLFGAAINWRPHGLVIGPPGAGKSTLFEFYAVASPLAAPVNDYTEPGLRQAMTGRAGPMLLDEADEDPESMGRLQAVISMLRRSSSGAGARSLKGGANGVGQRFEVNSAALLGAVLPPPLMPQDETRFTKLSLRPPDDPRQALHIPGAAEFEKAGILAPHLWGRAVAGLRRFEANLAALRAVMLARGCTFRLADQIGTILAARATMLDDVALSIDAAEAEIDAVSWVVLTASEQLVDNGPALCLQHLLSSATEYIQHGERPTIGRLVAAAMLPDGGNARRILVDHGLAVRAVDRSEKLYLCVANAHPRLRALFTGTTWHGGRWREALATLTGAEDASGPIRFGPGFKPRCVIIPADLVAGEDDGTGAGVSLSPADRFDGIPPP